MKGRGVVVIVAVVNMVKRLDPPAAAPACAAVEVQGLMRGTQLLYKRSTCLVGDYGAAAAMCWSLAWLLLSQPASTSRAFKSIRGLGSATSTWPQSDPIDNRALRAYV